jgi:hypothetical protein
VIIRSALSSRTMFEQCDCRAFLVLCAMNIACSLSFLVRS